MLSKNRLVLSVIKKYIDEHPNIELNELKNIFPDELQGSHGVVKTLDEYRNENLKGKRFFDAENEIIYLSDETPIVVCSQWGIGNVTRFNEQVRKIGYTIEKIDS